RLEDVAVADRLAAEPAGHRTMAIRQVAEQAVELGASRVGTGGCPHRRRSLRVHGNWRQRQGSGEGKPLPPGDLRSLHGVATPVEEWLTLPQLRRCGALCAYRAQAWSPQLSASAPASASSAAAMRSNASIRTPTGCAPCTTYR